MADGRRGGAGAARLAPGPAALPAPPHDRAARRLVAGRRGRRRRVLRAAAEGWRTAFRADRVVPVREPPRGRAARHDVRHGGRAARLTRRRLPGPVARARLASLTRRHPIPEVRPRWPPSCIAGPSSCSTRSGSRRAWYNIAADLPVPPSPPLHPGHRPADRARGPRAAVPDGADPAGRQPGPRGRDPGAGPRGLPALPAVARCYRAHRLEAALGTPAHIYYKYEGVQPVREPQAQHRAPAGVVQQGRGRRPAWRPRPAPASGAARSPSPARCSASRSRSTWSARATTRSRTAGC